MDGSAERSSAPRVIAMSITETDLAEKNLSRAEEFEGLN
jgi:hypothetical protein